MPRYDAIVDPSGGDYGTLQDMDDAIGASSYVAMVRRATYTAGLTLATNNVRIAFHPGTVVQGDIELSGDGINAVFYPGCDVQGLLTMSGAGCKVQCYNNCLFDGLLMSGNNGTFHGGGKGTLIDGGIANDAVFISGSDCLVSYFAASTTGGGETSNKAVMINGGDRCAVFAAMIVDSDETGITVWGNDHKILGCHVLSADRFGISVLNNRNIIKYNNVQNVGDAGIKLNEFNGGASDNIVEFNIVKDHADFAIQVDGASEDNVVCGNVLDDLASSSGISDLSGTSIVDNNVEASF